MKISVSLPGDVVAYLDEYVRTHSIASRSAALQHAVDLLRADELAVDYEVAFTEWHTSGESEVWESAVSDGLPSGEPELAGDAAR